MPDIPSPWLSLVNLGRLGYDITIMSEDEYVGTIITSVIFAVGVGMATGNVGFGLIAGPVFFFLIVGIHTLVKRSCR